MNQVRRWLTAEDGSVLLEGAFGVAVILTIALPFASLVAYATASARDLSAVQGAVREAARSETATATDSTIALTCGNSVSAGGTCVAPLARGTYIAALRDTSIKLPFGLVLHTNARGVARVE